MGTTKPNCARLVAIASLAFVCLAGCVSRDVPFEAVERYHLSVGLQHQRLLRDLQPDGSLPPSPDRALTREELEIRIGAVDDFGRLLEAVREAQVIGGGR